MALYLGSALLWALLGRFAAWAGHRITTPGTLPTDGREGPISWAFAGVLCLAAPVGAMGLGIALRHGGSFALGIVVGLALALLVRRVALPEVRAPAALKAQRRRPQSHPPWERFPWDDPSRWRS